MWCSERDAGIATSFLALLFVGLSEMRELSTVETEERYGENALKTAPGHSEVLKARDENR